MPTDWRDRTLLDLLTEHGLELSPEHEFPNDGWSGATFTSLEDRSGRRYVLKRSSLSIDWIARATRDDALREGWLASRPAGALAWMPAATALGAAADGDGVAILMPDLSTALIAWDGPGHDSAIDTATLSRVLEAMARLHASPWSRILETSAERDGEAAAPWCPLPERLTLLTRSSADRYAADANPVGERFLAGWDAFDRQATGAARDLIDRLSANLDPLVAALAGLPVVGLHGDLKLANVALLDDGRVGFIDWQLTLRAPIAVELGWFLVANSGALPIPPEAVMTAYRDRLDLGDHRPEVPGQGPALTNLIGDWETQVDLALIVGLLLRGWRKGLDAGNRVRLPSGVDAADDLAWWCARATAAADRRL